MKKTLTSLLLFFPIIVCLSQTIPQQLPKLQDGWQRIYVKNLGSFDLPPTMEVQKGKYKEYIDDLNKKRGYDANQLVAQQKGLNSFENNGFKKYARVMLETTIKSPGDYSKLDFNILTISQSDIQELNITFKQQIEQGFIGSDLKLIEWYPLKIEKANGMSCLHIRYKRQLKNEPLVLVNTYIFQNNDRMHTLTLSYRLSDVGFWKVNYDSILKSFRITNIK